MEEPRPKARLLPLIVYYPAYNKVVVSLAYLEKGSLYLEVACDNGDLFDISVNFKGVAFNKDNFGCLFGDSIYPSDASLVNFFFVICLLTM